MSQPNEVVRLIEPTEPLVVTDEDITRNASLMTVAENGYILLIKKPNDDKLYGPVENSFSLGVEPNRTFLYWSSVRWGLDAWTWVNKDLDKWRQDNPDWDYTIYKAMDKNLPVAINWDLWLDAHSPSNKTLSGVKNKYDCRNLKFTLKGEARDEQKTSQALSTTITMYSLDGGNGVIA
jgi:hypothetical protein